MSNNPYTQDKRLLLLYDDPVKSIGLSTKSYTEKSRYYRTKNLGVLANQGSILEYGCGEGLNIYGLSHAIGYEEEQVRIQYCKRRQISVVHDLSLLKGRTFDVVLCAYHLTTTPQPLQLLQTLTAFMHQHSKLVLILHHQPADHGKGISRYFSPTHPEQVGKLLEQVGLKIVHHERRHTAGLTKLWPWARWIGLGGYDKLTTLAGYLLGRSEWLIHAVRI